MISPENKALRSKGILDLKVCIKCKRELSLDEFRTRNGKHGKLPGSICKQCVSDASKQKLRKEPKLKTIYKMSVEEYMNRYGQQGGKCAICGVRKPITYDRLVVDHNHSTGKVRGLLCPNCNKGLGFFKDDINSLAKAIKYLNHES